MPFIFFYSVGKKLWDAKLFGNQEKDWMVLTLCMYSFHFKVPFSSLYYLTLTMIPWTLWTAIIIFLLWKNLAKKGEHLHDATGNTCDRTWSWIVPAFATKQCWLRTHFCHSRVVRFWARHLSPQSPYPETESYSCEDEHIFDTQEAIFICSKWKLIHLFSFEWVAGPDPE